VPQKFIDRPCVSQGPVPVGTGKAVTIDEAAEIMMTVLGKKPP
jgi:hypothetical protein